MESHKTKMKQLPLLIELKPNGHNSTLWQLNNDFWARGDQWVQSRKRWTYPVITLMLCAAFSAAMSPWVRNYQTAKEINSIAIEMHSFKSLYRNYGDGHVPSNKKSFAEPLNNLLNSIMAKMTIIGMPEQKIDVIKSTYADKNYYLVGSSKEILVKPMTYDACSRMMEGHRTLHRSLQQAVIDSLKPEHQTEISCYLQTWKSTPPPEMAAYSVTIDGIQATPMALLIIKPAKTPKSAAPSRRLMSI